MNNEFDAADKRLRRADENAPELSADVLEKAIKSPRKSGPSISALRFIVMSVAGLAAVSIFATSLPSEEQPLITLASDNSASQGVSESSMATDSSTADSLPAWFNPFVYIPSQSLSDETGDGVVYELVIEGNPSQRLREFAEIFGQEGSVELEQWSTEYFPSYKLETDEAYFSLYWHGSAIINYSSKRNWLSEDCYLTDEELVDPEMEVVRGSGCEPLPTVPMPTADVLAQEAYETISKAGFDGNLSDIVVERYEWGASAFASTSVDGVETAIEWYVSWDQTAQLSNISGHLAKPQRIGEFDTVSPVDAVSRIADGYWFGAAPRSFYEYTFAEAALEAPEDDEFLDEEMETLPVEPFPEPGEIESIELIVEDATEATLLIQDSEGKGWLVPGYLLRTDQGWFEPVVSLQTGVIEPPK